MKEIKELLEHEHHEHERLEKKRLQLLSETKAGQEAYFKRHEKSLRARGDVFRKERRKFLDFMGRTGISGGLLKAFPAIAGVVAARQSYAQTDAKRAVFCYINSGAPNGYWLPTGVTEMNEVTQHYAGVAEICHFREIDAMVEGHARATQALGARGYGQPTADALASPVLSANTPFSQIFVGSEVAGADISSLGKPKADPQVALKDYFSPGGGDNGGPDMSYLKVYQAQQRALESIKSKLSAEERERLNEHAAAFEKIEKRITQLMSDGAIKPEECAPDLPSASEYIASGAGGDQTKMVEHGKAQADLIIAGLKCGLTNVGTLQLGSEQGHWKTYGIDHYGGFNDTSHGSVHAGRLIAEQNDKPISFIECHRYLSQVPVYLIEQLMTQYGPDGKLLIDTTVFAQVTCMGNGMDHSTPNSPFLLATRMPGFKRGFSATNQAQNNNGGTYDFNETVLRGLGIGADFESTNTLGLLES